jgi:hypothetical protein
LKFTNIFIKTKGGVAGSEPASRAQPYVGEADIEGTVGSLLPY